MSTSHAFVIAGAQDLVGNFDETWDFRGDANLVRFGMDLGWQVIHAPKTVEWNKGDEFEAARKASEVKP